MVDETNDQLKNKKAKQQAKKNKVIKTTSVEEVVFESSDLSIVRYVLSGMYCQVCIVDSQRYCVSLFPRKSRQRATTLKSNKATNN